MTEFLVVMTASVPDGTSQDDVGERRRRDGANSRGLTTHGQLRRLWRSPAPPGDWRSIGLFEADDQGHLDKLLSVPPLQIWHTEEVTALGAHPDDPAATGVIGRPGKGPEFLIATTITVPSGTAPSVVEEAETREAARAHDLAERGHLVRLWRLPEGPDGPRTLGLWRARDPGELLAIVESLPLSGWVTIETTPLSPHPDDPIRMRWRLGLG